MDAMMIVGLGNPGREYDGTRHNVGFDIADRWVAAHKGAYSAHKGKGLLADLRVAGKRVLVAKPTTFMNLSGEFVVPLAHFYKISHTNILIVHDDMDLPLGRLRLARGGSAAGHRGVASIQQLIGQDSIPRFKVGIGHPGDKSRVTGFVLTRFTAQEQQLWDKVLEVSNQILDTFVARGLQESMNKFNNFNAAPKAEAKGEQASERPGAGPNEGR